MAEFSALLQPDQGQAARSIRVVARAELEEWLKSLPERARVAAGAARFAAKPGDLAILPGDKPEDWSVAIGAADSPGPWDLAAAADQLPAGTYRLHDRQPGIAAIGWLLAQYRFSLYRSEADEAPQRVLLSGEPAQIEETVRLAEATVLVRDMVNTPAADMGPAQIEAEAERVAQLHAADFRVTRGDALEQGYPLVHAVGRAAASSHAPRLIEIEWGKPDHPRVAILGKGVAFDSGGLDIKPASGMRLMKKDMGGAAHAIALARLVMQAGLPVRLHMLVPAVENAISGNAFRPGDIVKSRSGKTVEIDNTDAEGRLILADALTRAGEDSPGLILDFATLTGAARVALGPDLPALFANDHDLASDLNRASVDVGDPVWRLPLWSGYDEMLKSGVADVANSAEGGMAGAITAALFLRRFVAAGTPWAHLDTFAWRTANRPGRPKGGDALGLRACWTMLKRRYGASSA